MNLLPLSDVDFAETEYWDKFFRKRGSKEFEWYGEYEQLSSNLLKYLRKEDSILMIGCGNSMLSSDLFDDGYRNITNIDISSVAIKQMQAKVGEKRPEMVFQQMDALNMSYEDDKFHAVIDKGTLDALMPTDSLKDKERARKLFVQVDRILKISGRYITISLLQKHILEEILKYFCQIGYMIRLTRCWDVERKTVLETGHLTFPVFMVVCVKLKKMLNPCSILEVNIFINGKSERVKSKEEVLAMIEGLQKTVLHCREARGEVEIKFCKTREETPRYTIYLVDASPDQRQLLKYAAFIVPHGRETEWMFGTPEGRKYLRESTDFDRLAVVTFHRNQDYGSLSDVQDELRQAILQLAPSCMPLSTASPKVPYLTLGDGVGSRKTVFSGVGDFSGEIVVEEIEIENETFRRLIFMDNQAVVQSEVKLKRDSSGSGRGEIDFSHVGSNHITYMSIPAAMKNSEGSGFSVAVLGLGGGGLCLFLRELYPTADVTGVEVDPLVVRTAERFFGFEPGERLKVVVEDGLEFLKRKPKLDIVAFDVDSKERGSAVSCPPPSFVEPSALKNVAEILGNTGIFVTNVVSRVKSEHEKLIKKIRRHFTLVAWYDLKEDVNRIVYASNRSELTNAEWQKQIKDAACDLSERAREKLNLDDNSFDINHLMKELAI